MQKPSYQRINVDPAFPVKSIYMSSQDNKDLFYCHWHTNIEIIHVIQGKVTLFIDNVPWSLNEGDLCVINPNQVHYGNEVDQIDTKVQLIILSYDILPYSHNDIIYQKYVAPLSSGDYFLPTVFRKTQPSDLNISIKDYEACRCILLKLLGYGYRIFKGREIAIQGAFMELISAMHNYQLLIPSADEKVRRIGSRNLAVLEYVEKHFTKQINIPSLAKHFGFNEDYFYRLFKKYTGQTPTTFINQLRIRYSKQLLRNTDMSISEISYEIGFSSSSYFTKLFNRYNSISPTQYRKNYHKSDA